jgi:small subunit ribosomal protein S20
LANSKTAEKRHRQSVGRRLRNRTAKSEVRTAIKRFLVSVNDGNKDEADKQFNGIKKLLDTAVSRGIMHKNTVARKKSRLAKHLNSMN